MGKNLIITESEKKHILSLYESAPPPSESVLIANKNPFSETSLRYLSGQTIGEYGGELKDGNLFYVLKRDLIKEWCLNLVNKTLEGKEVRTFFGGYLNTSGDKIVKISKFSEMWFPDVVLAPKDKDKLCFYKCYDWVHFSLLSDGTYTDHDYSTMSDTSNSILNALKPIVSWKKVPDEYFEIRKIQRQKTDF